MTRRLLNLLMALSLLLCVAVVVLWPLGYWRGDSVTLADGSGHAFGATSQPGLLRLSVDWGNDWPAAVRHQVMRWGEMPPLPPELASRGVKLGPTKPYVPPGTRWGFGLFREAQAAIRIPRRSCRTGASPPCPPSCRWWPQCAQPGAAGGAYAATALPAITTSAPRRESARNAGVPQQMDKHRLVS